MQDREGLDDGNAGDVGATDVQQPADAVGQGQDGGRVAGVAQGLGDAGAFAFIAFAGQFGGVAR